MSSASFVLKSANTFTFGDRNGVASSSLEGSQLALACLMNGRIGVATKKIKAIEAEISTQCFLAVENIASAVITYVGKEGEMRLPCACLS